MLGALSIYKDTMKDLYSSIEDCEKFSNVGSPLRSIHDAWVRGCLAGKSCRSPTAFAVPCYQFCWKPTNLSTSLRLWHLRYTKSCLKFWWFTWHLESHDSGILGFKNLHHPTIPPHPLADLQPTSLHKHASSPCMLPTYSLQVCTNMHPHPVCCQPTAYKFAQTCILTLYVANLQPASLHKHASSPCMLPTYSLQVCTNMHPHPVCCQPTAYKFAQTCILTLYVANLQPTSLHKHASSPCMLPTYSLQVCTSMHPHPVCCQPTAYKFAQTCILTLYVANLQPTSLHKHASSPCMLPTYSLQVCTSMHPHPVCCQPTAYKFAQTCILTVYVANLQPTSLHKPASSPCMLPTYSLQVCTNMHPHPVCCQPTVYKFAQTCILTLYVANLQPTSLHKHASSPCMLPTYSLQVCTNMHPHRVCCQPTAYKFAQTCILTVYVANLQPTSLHKHASSPCMLPTYSLQVGPSMHPRPVCCQPTAYKFAQTCILTLHLANLQPASSPKHASSPCMLPTYSLQVCTNMHPHRVCCQPTAYKFAPTCILTVYVANLQPTSLHKHASSPCMLPTYSLQVCTNMHPHAASFQPTAYKFAQTCILALYVANLQPASWPNMHPHRVCCQPTAHKLAQACILTLYVANLQHVSSPCMLPTYSLQVCTNMHPHHVCCQPTAYKFAQTCILTLYVANLQPTSLHKHASSPCMLPTYSLQVCTNMHPHPVCCQPTACKFAQTCILTLYVANLQPTSLHKHASSPCMLPTYSLQVCTNMHPHRVCCQPTAYKFAQTCILALYVASLQPTSLHKHASSRCIFPTYSLQVRPNMHPRPVCCQPAAYKFDLPSFLTLLPTYSLQVGPSMHPRPVCCQPTACKLAKHASSPCVLPTYSLQVRPNMCSPCMLPTCSLQVRPTILPHPLANLQPTSWPKHASSPCMLPTYSLQVGQTCILTVCVANLQPTSFHNHVSSPCRLPTYSLQVCTNMQHRGGCHPTAPIARKCANLQCVAILAQTCNALQWPDFSCSLKRRLATCPNSIAARLYRRALRSATEHGIPWYSCVGLPPNAATTGAQEAHAKRTLQTNWVVPGPFRNGLLCFPLLMWVRLLEADRDRDRQTWHIIFQCFILEVIPLASFFSSSSHI